MDNLNPPKTTTEYMVCFRNLAAITDNALGYVERKANSLSETDKKKTLARIAESVGTISSLRGDTAAFIDSRTDGLAEYQKEMYAVEDYLRARLLKLGYKYPMQA